MHPISKIRLETHVAVIRLKELPSGFRVLSAEAALIESLPEEFKKPSREDILSFQTNRPDDVCCLAVLNVEAIDGSKIRFLFNNYGFGPYSNIAAIQKKAATENDRQADLIKMLNKEI
jgi:hypothetical protein